MSVQEMEDRNRRLDDLLGVLFQAHPWHGISPGDDAPALLRAFIEIVPADAVKYELDKETGQLRLDRPQRYSSLCPTLYGFIPQTYCGDAVAEICMQRTGLTGVRGDGDPMDICVLTEKSFTHGNLFLRARPIGGFRMIDGREADDKIIAILDSDIVYNEIQDINQCPRGLLDRLRHYFLTYKQLPEEAPRRVEIAQTYGRDEALETISRSLFDYRAKFGAPENRLDELRRLLK